MKKSFLILTISMLLFGYMISQNIAITDDDAYTANSSAMLDVKSLTKGLLVPRLTTAQRTAIVTPATGLLVFDTTINGFYFYNGSAWINLSSGSSGGMFWSYTSPNIYMTTGTNKLGLGTSSPIHKLHLLENVVVIDGTDGNFIDIQNTNTNYGVMSGIRFMNGTTANTFKGGIFYQDNLTNGRGNLILANNTTNSATNVTAENARLVLQSDGRVMVKGDPNQGINAAIFAVQNSDGDTIFAVYPEGVRVWVNDAGGSKATGNRGGFAVGGFSPSKAGFTNEYLRVTPDSVRVYIDDDFVGSKASGNRGGFAVGGFSPSKGAITDSYLFVQDDSTRVYVADSLQGFGVENIEGVNNQRIMRLTTENYFIGHESGTSITSGLYNTFFGYQTGLSTTGGVEVAPGEKEGSNNILIGYQAGKNINTGLNNIYIGYQSGIADTAGVYNTFIGFQSGTSNKGSHVSSNGSYNTFVGCKTGSNNITGGHNSFYGNISGWNNTTGSYNAFYGTNSGLRNTTGAGNTFIGAHSGWYTNAGSQNTFIGRRSGYSNTVGNNNVFVGYESGYNETGSEKLYIENSNAGSTGALIYGEFDNNILRFNAKVGINTTPSYYLHVIDNVASNDDPAIYGMHNVTNNYGVGILGKGGYMGVKAENTSTTGSNYGAYASATGAGTVTNYGVYGTASGTGTGTRYGVYGYASGGTTAWAGYFSGNVNVTGTLSKGGGSFKIDHPLDPENKYLYHSFVESPDMMNIYNGIIILDSQGKATVNLPDYFEALNNEFRYTLTPIGSPAPNLYIEEEVAFNQFKIAGGNPGMKVSWQVTGIRKDPFAVKNRIPVEVEKDSEDKGYYLYPDLYKQSIEKGIDYKNNNTK
ncbi:MAG: hypothetical protein ABIJ97_14120 [Bacteroidota bacterium]